MRYVFPKQEFNLNKKPWASKINVYDELGEDIDCSKPDLPLNKVFSNPFHKGLVFRIKLHLKEALGG